MWEFLFNHDDETLADRITAADLLFCRKMTVHKTPFHPVVFPPLFSRFLDGVEGTVYPFGEWLFCPAEVTHSCNAVDPGQNHRLQM
jgi:hypothetical protein